MNIRDEDPRDWNAVFQVITSAFGHSAEAMLVDALRKEGDSVISLVAEQDGQIVGHVLLSKMSAPFAALALAPVAVVPSRQRNGVGAALIRCVVERARSEGWDAIFVLGDPSYYQRFGFDKGAAAGFTSIYAGPHFMMLQLSPSLGATSGELRHARAFGDLV
ncbi:GCN5-related N-acetyltransferase [Candidatus Koribacter versatilis Ellin345]|uniref:GCN5-related N-acetyltransferase n=1 Tax=Koribacter versatilis (strain Ellin345) TaxID=204669 RepID=Q1IJJ6_KORVE|nr:N-acetyltransferase [Candidatus Koribacter versatilis]ABF42954.1 GCN5-related N-acetyltransferase [Candidatus Koribacter versatilis Ellin345]